MPTKPGLQNQALADKIISEAYTGKAVSQIASDLKIKTKKVSNILYRARHHYNLNVPITRNNCDSSDIMICPSRKIGENLVSFNVMVHCSRNNEYLSPIEKQMIVRRAVAMLYKDQIQGHEKGLVLYGYEINGEKTETDWCFDQSLLVEMIAAEVFLRITNGSQEDYETLIWDIKIFTGE